MSWVISLGAGREQLPLIRAIQAEGYKCLAYDQDPCAAGWDVADEFRCISNRDAIGILGNVEFPDAVAGVMAAGSEVPDVMAILAHRMGLPGVPVATGMAIKDKLVQKNVLRAAGVPCTGPPDGEDCVVVVKPRISSGSRGVRKASSSALLEAGEMIERYQPGPQVSSETLIWDDQAHTVAFADRHYAAFAKEVGVSQPSRFEDQRIFCSHVAVRAARALGIQRGTLKCDLVLTEEGPKIIECTCRLSGGPLQLLVERSSGVNYFREAVKIAVGKEPDWGSMIGRESKKVSVDMLGNETSWEDAARYIEPRLGACA